MSVQSDPKFEAGLMAWLAGAQAKIDNYYRTTFPTLETPTLTLERGRRYIRVVRADSQRSVFAFIDINGDVLKAESWKKPALHARGNIFDASGGLAAVGPYGPAYLR
jgi:hypothetical protein